ncbi:hypothetical protein B4V02_23825 [Paenibacillus kribbensis]|uniref:Uncharacterized protein n=1 Tax=Paenibacillus kribbensis TaxID=172713 RepID=A0A222WU27_9BACL|nr:hypothetical protein B4V02_23825 [Paenibacillus kribbensis]
MGGLEQAAEKDLKCCSCVEGKKPGMRTKKASGLMLLAPITRAPWPGESVPAKALYVPVVRFT